MENNKTATQFSSSFSPVGFASFSLSKDNNSMSNEFCHHELLFNEQSLATGYSGGRAI